MFGVDAFAPEHVARRIQAAGDRKARLPAVTLGMLGMLGGGFVSLGCLLYLALLPASGAALLLAGVGFAMGYMIVFSAGAEVFTSNVLMVMAWASRRLPASRLARAWGIVLLANIVGASGLALVANLSGLMDGLGDRAAAITQTKLALGPFRSVASGILGNVLVCLALWVATAGRTLADKVLGAVLPLAAVGVLGVEHVTASAFFLALAWTGGDAPGFVPAVAHLAAVTLGNLLGGGVMVALVYHAVYGRKEVAPSHATQ